MRPGMRRLAPPLPALSRLSRGWAEAPRRQLCAGASSGLDAALSRLSISPDAVPPSADPKAVLRQLRFLEVLGVPDVAAAVARDPSVLSHNAERLASRHVDYLLSLGIARVGPMIEAVPQLLSCDLTHDLHRKVSIVQALGVKKIGTWLYKNRGRVATMDVDEDLRPPIEYLRTIPQLQVHKVLEALPHGVFGKGKAEELEARVAYLTEELILADDLLGKMISRSPFVLTMSLEGLKAKVTRTRHCPNCAAVRSSSCHEDMHNRSRFVTVAKQDIYRPSSCGGLPSRVTARPPCNHPQSGHCRIKFQGAADADPCVRACPLLSLQIEWFRSLGVSDVGAMLARHPAVLNRTLANLQAKHDFLADVWGRSVDEIEAFPQVYTYSLHYLRARAGFLKLKDREGVGLIRSLRTADYLFAKQCAQSSIEQYQAFARAVKAGGGSETYDAHDVEARAPGGGGEAYDWGDASLESMIETVGTPRLAEREVLHAELTAVEKHMAFNDEMLAKDRKLEAEILSVRRAVHAFLDGDGGSVEELEVEPVSESAEGGAATDGNAAGGPSEAT